MMEPTIQPGQPASPDIRGIGLRWGIIAGAVYVFLETLLYTGGPEFFGGWYRIIVYAIIVAIVTYAGLQRRRAQGGYMTFREALNTVFLAFVIAEVFYWVYSYILYNFIDPHLNEAMKQYAMDQAAHMMQRFKAPQEKMDEALANIQKNDFKVTIGKSLQGMGIWLIWDFIVCCIVSLIIRKKPMITDALPASENLT